MSEKEIVIPLAELERLEIACTPCNNSITFLAKETSRFPTECPSCGKALASGIVQKWIAWKNFLSEAKEAEIQFRIKR